MRSKRSLPRGRGGVRGRPCEGLRWRGWAAWSGGVRGWVGNALAEDESRVQGDDLLDEAEHRQLCVICGARGSW